jgi:ABC-type multidrug transport system fused ATPase/permease subunit
MIADGFLSFNRDLKVAYVAQKAWLMNATLRENVLFGRQFETEKYENILQKSALLPDLEMLVAGDQTQIGEKV